MCKGGNEDSIASDDKSVLQTTSSRTVLVELEVLDLEIRTRELEIFFQI